MSRRSTRSSVSNWYGPSRPEFSGRNEARLLRGGDESFPLMIERVTAARNEVWLATYIFHQDAAGEALLQALLAAARRGVKVRMVVDGFGSKASIPWLLGQARESGVALAIFRPIRRWWSWLNPGQLRRLHQKLCVVDGEWATVGGINIVDDRVDINHGATDEPRLDFAVALSGPVVRPVEQAARAVWSRAWLGRDFGEELLAAVRGPAPARRMKQLWRSLRMPRGEGRGKSRDLPPVCAAFVLRDNLRQRRTIEHAYVEAIREARSSVDLITPYFYPGQSFRRALREAARRGVQVRLLLQGKVDYALAGMAARALYAELLAHGVQIFEYTPAYLHAKVAVIDGHWATVGSSNIDPLSLLLNLEANVIVLDDEFAAHLRREFESALEASTQVDHSGGLRGMAGRALVAWVAYVYLRVAGATGRY